MMDNDSKELDLNIIRIKAASGAALENLLHLRSLDRLERMSWDDENSLELMHNLFPAYEFLGKDTFPILLLAGEFLTGPDLDVKNYEVIDDLIRLIDTKIMKL